MATVAVACLGIRFEFRVAHCHEQAAEDPKKALIRLIVGIDMTHRRLELKGKDMAALEVCGVYVGA